MSKKNRPPDLSAKVAKALHAEFESSIGSWKLAIDADTSSGVLAEGLKKLGHKVIEIDKVLPPKTKDTVVHEWLNKNNVRAFITKNTRTDHFRGDGFNNRKYVLYELKIRRPLGEMVRPLYCLLRKTLHLFKTSPPELKIYSVTEGTLRNNKCG